MDSAVDMGIGKLYRIFKSAWGGEHVFLYFFHCTPVAPSLPPGLPPILPPGLTPVLLPPLATE